MDPALAVALAVNVVADELSGGAAPREVVVRCVCCLNEEDPKHEWSTYAAPASSQCMSCANPKRWAEGMVYAVRDRRPG